MDTPYFWIFFRSYIINFIRTPSFLKGAPWRDAWLRRYEKHHNVAVRRGAWQGVIWCAMARYGVLWRVFFRLIHSFFSLCYVFSNRRYKYYGFC